MMGCASDASTSPHQQQEPLEQPPSSGLAATRNGPVPFDSFCTEDHLLGLALGRSRLHSYNMHSGNAGVETHSDAAAILDPGFCNMLPQHGSLANEFRNGMVSQAMLGMFGRAQSDSTSYSRASHNCCSSDEQQQRSLLAQGQMSASQVELESTGPLSHHGHNSSPNPVSDVCVGTATLTVLRLLLHKKLAAM